MSRRASIGPQGKADPPFVSLSAQVLASKHQLTPEQIPERDSQGRIRIRDVRSALARLQGQRAREKAEAGVQDLPTWAPQFLACLVKDPNVSAACRAIGVSRRTAEDARLENALFAAAWKEAIETSIDDLETEARRRAVEGVPGQAAYYEGMLIPGSRLQAYSDRLLIVLLQAHRPDKFAQRTVTEGHMTHDITGRITSPSDAGERRLADLIERLSVHLGVPPEGSAGPRT